MSEDPIITIMEVDLALGYPNRTPLPCEAALLARHAAGDLKERSEGHFLRAFYGFAGQRIIPPHSFICNSATTSLNIVTDLLRDNGMNLAIPNDSLQEIFLDTFKKARIRLQPLDEKQKDFCYAGELEEAGLQTRALFLVTPDNPIGSFLNRTAFQKTVEYCSRNSILLIMDNCFRFNIPPEERFQQYQVLRDSGVSFFMIEDTGKNIQADGHKVSILTFSDDLFPQVEDLLAYDQAQEIPGRKPKGASVTLLTHWFESCAAETFAENDRLRALNRATLRKAISVAPQLVCDRSKETSSFVCFQILDPYANHLDDYLKDWKVTLRPQQELLTVTPNLINPTSNRRASLLRDPGSVRYAAQMIRLFFKNRIK